MSPNLICLSSPLPFDSGSGPLMSNTINTSLAHRLADELVCLSSVTLRVRRSASALPHLVQPNSSTEEGANDLSTIMVVRFATPSPFSASPNHRSVKPSIIVPVRWLSPSNFMAYDDKECDQTVKGFFVRPFPLLYIISYGFPPTPFPTVPEFS